MENCVRDRFDFDSTPGFEITMPGSDAATAPRGLKILVVGPSAAGKSALANFLGDPECDSLQQPATYNETKGVR